MAPYLGIAGGIPVLRSRLVTNTALLTASSLLMSVIGMTFQVWLVGRIGSAGIGLYQLTVSVADLAATVAISGIRFASTRLIAEELGRESPAGILEGSRRCLCYALFFGVAAGLILYNLAQPLGFLWIRDARTVLSLRIASLSMPCISLCASMSGYFTACGRVWKPTLVHLLEQLAGIALAALCLSRAPAGDIEKSCAAVTLGRLAADLLSLLLMAALFMGDRQRYYGHGQAEDGLTGRMLRLAMPLALSAYARSALTTIQHLLVPRGLKAAGYSSDGALSGYGIVQGMALPVLFFPSCVLAAAAELIVPELTEAQVRGDGRGIRRTAGKLLRLSLLFSLAVTAFLLLFARQLAVAVYHSEEAGRFIRLLAPLVPVMYLDMVVDGCLKGLGQQLWSMCVNIVESLLGLALILYLLPRYALSAYLAILYITELFNFALSLGRLRRIIPRRDRQLSSPCG